MALRDDLKTELAQLADDALYTEKSYHEAADQWSRYDRIVGISTTLSAAGSAVTIIAESAPAVSAILAVIATAGGALKSFMNFGDLHDAALRAARELNALRVNIRQVLKLRLPYIPDAELYKVVEMAAELATTKATVDKDAPLSHNRHYNRAKKRIDSGEFG